MPVAVAHKGRFVVSSQADLGRPVLAAKIFRFTRRANHLYKFAPSRPTQRGVSRSSRTRDGVRWTRQRLACDGIAGLVERLVSGQQHADERCCSVRRSRVVLTPGFVVWSRKPSRSGLWSIRVVLAAGQPLPVCGDEQISSDSVGMSQTCQHLAACQ